MTDFRILVTDLTEYGELRCVAGWDIDAKRMIRPEPAPAAFWPQADCGLGKTFNPGNIVVFKAALPNPPTQLPHFNEDRIVKGAVTLEKQLSRNDFTEALRKLPTVGSAMAFALPVQSQNTKAYVPTGTDHPSLRGLLIKKRDITFTTEKYGDGPAKIRCVISMPKGPSINLSIAACNLRETFRKGGRDGVKNLFQAHDTLHIRLGLARGFGNYPDRCYMQVNGIFGI